jgi:hypothetical protein
MKELLKRWRNKLPWNRPRLSDLPLEERRRVKAMILGASSGRQSSGKIEVKHTNPDTDAGEK